MRCCLTSSFFEVAELTDCDSGTSESTEDEGFLTMDNVKERTGRTREDKFDIVVAFVNTKPHCFFIIFIT
jgi:hypothetical protein